MKAHESTCTLPCVQPAAITHPVHKLMVPPTMTLQNMQCTLTKFCKITACVLAHLSHSVMLATCGCLQQGLAAAAAQATCDLSHRAPLQPEAGEPLVLNTAGRRRDRENCENLCPEFSC